MRFTQPPSRLSLLIPSISSATRSQPTGQLELATARRTPGHSRWSRLVMKTISAAAASLTPSELLPSMTPSTMRISVFRSLPALTSPTCLPKSLPRGVWVDYHDYNLPDGLVGQFNYFDNLDRSVPYYVGEYAQSKVDVPVMKGSVAQAVFMIGIERNSDLVKMASYAPPLQPTNSTQWKVCYDRIPELYPWLALILLNLARLDPLHSKPRRNRGYKQLLFSVNRGDTIKEVTSDSGF